MYMKGNKPYALSLNKSTTGSVGNKVTQLLHASMSVIMMDILSDENESTCVNNFMVT
jgi:hypothetical protein